MDNDTRFDNGTATNGNNFDGIIDEVSLYNTVLTPDQIQRHFLLTTTEPSAFLIWALGLLGLAWYARRRR